MSMTANPGGAGRPMTVRDLPTFLLSLLSKDYLFFGEGDVFWDGAHHEIRGLQFNAAKLDGLLDYARSVSDFVDEREVASYLISFLHEAEKDEVLVVPREEVAPGLLVPFWEGDLTAVSLALYATCAAALVVEGGGEGYVVFYDTRLARGIPRFFDRVARLLWDLRACTRSLAGEPFSVTFAGVRNLDADRVFGEVADFVAGAQEPQALMRVEGVPTIGALEEPEPPEPPGVPEEAPEEAPLEEPPGEEAPEEVPAETAGNAPSKKRAKAERKGSARQGFPAERDLARARAAREKLSERVPELSEEQVLDVERYLDAADGLLPMTLSVTGWPNDSRLRASYRKPKVGERVVLASDWGASAASIPRLEVFSVEGVSLGYVSVDAVPGSKSLATMKGVAYLLPHLRAYVAHVISHPTERLRHVFDVHVEPVFGVARDLWRQTAQLLAALPPRGRVCVSRGALVDPRSFDGATKTSRFDVAFLTDAAVPALFEHPCVEDLGESPEEICAGLPDDATSEVFDVSDRLVSALSRELDVLCVGPLERQRTKLPHVAEESVLSGQGAPCAAFAERHIGCVRDAMKTVLSLQAQTGDVAQLRRAYDAAGSLLVLIECCHDQRLYGERFGVLLGDAQPAPDELLRLRRYWRARSPENVLRRREREERARRERERLRTIRPTVEQGAPAEELADLDLSERSSRYHELVVRDVQRELGGAGRWEEHEWADDACARRVIETLLMRGGGDSRDDLLELVSPGEKWPEGKGVRGRKTTGAVASIAQLRDYGYLIGDDRALYLWCQVDRRGRALPDFEELRARASDGALDDAQAVLDKRLDDERAIRSEIEGVEARRDAARSEREGLSASVAELDGRAAEVRAQMEALSFFNVFRRASLASQLEGIERERSELEARARQLGKDVIPDLDRQVTARRKRLKRAAKSIEGARVKLGEAKDELARRCASIDERIAEALDYMRG